MSKAPVFDPEKYRSDFPILQQKVHRKPLIYFDNAATTQKPQSVIDSISHYYTHDNSNVHRAIHQLGERATESFENSRKNIANFIGAKSESQIVFTRGASEAINLVAKAWGGKFIGKDDEIILSEMEHHSNLIPWQLIAKEVGAKLKFIPITMQGTLDFNRFDSLLTHKTKLISITHMSNVFGTINPIKNIIRMAHDRGIPVLLDAAQSVPHLPIDVDFLDCDFLVFSGHKMLGPTGIGALYAKAHHLQNMNPYQGGGEMISSVWLENSTWNEIPHKFEAGTPHIAGAIGFSSAIDYLKNVGMRNITLYEQEITSYAINKMLEIEALTIYGSAPERGSAIAFNIEGIHPHDLAQYTDQLGIAIRAGHHCAQPIMRKLNLAATARVSFYFYNTFSEVDYFVDALKKAKKLFIS
jgi:cysteine desulfurase/selenocysteine lyase